MLHEAFLKTLTKLSTPPEARLTTVFRGQTAEQISAAAVREGISDQDFVRLAVQDAIEASYQPRSS